MQKVSRPDSPMVMGQVRVLCQSSRSSPTRRMSMCRSDPSTNTDCHSSGRMSNQRNLWFSDKGRNIDFHHLPLQRPACCARCCSCQGCTCMPGMSRIGVVAQVQGLGLGQEREVDSAKEWGQHRWNQVHHTLHSCT